MRGFPLLIVLLAALAVPALAAFYPQGSASEQKPAPPSQAKGATPAEAPMVIPSEAAAKPNPVKATPESVDAGKRLFVTQCAMCHGKEGDGKGDLAVELKWEVKDWRNAETLKDKTDGALLYLMTQGKGHMPGQEKRMSDTQKWNLVNFIRSLAKPSNKEEKKPAPDQP